MGEVQGRPQKSHRIFFMGSHRYRVMYEGHTNHDVQLSNTYDAFYCVPCNVWLEGTCGDDACSFCAERPPKPSLIHGRESF